MSTDTEKTIRTLKARIAREKDPIRKSNLRFTLSSMIKELADRDFQEKSNRLAGNAY